MVKIKKYKNMPLRGEHLMLTLEVDNDLENVKYLKKILFGAIKKSKATIIKFCEHKFKPQGYSIVVLIGESHASIHTYPENKGLFIDFFTCGEINTKVFKEYILSKLKVTKLIEVNKLMRGKK